jgi:hypothetical protein
MKTTKKTPAPSLFEKVCTCGKVYGEDCTIRADKCPEFLRHRAEVEKRMSLKTK